MNDQSSNRRRRKSISVIFMRVLLCSKIHCPSFICFCKPSSSVVAAASHLYNPGPLKLEYGHPPNSTGTTSVDDDDGVVEDGDGDDGQFSGKSIEAAADDDDDGDQEEEETADADGNQKPEIAALKSCLRKMSPESGNPEEQVEEVWKKKKVRWMDNLGKQLVEIKEFESSDRDSDNEMDNRTCVCTIL